MASLNDLLQTMVNWPQEKKISAAVDSFVSLMPTLAKYDQKTKGLTLLMGVLSATVCADGKLHSTEFAMVASILEVSGLKLSQDEVLDLIKKFNKQESYEMIKSMAKVLNTEDKASLITLVAAICSMDDKFSKEEVALIAALF